MLKYLQSLRSPATCSDLKNFLIIFAVALAGLGLLLANPGYFSHDELQKYDHVLRYGFESYIHAYVKLQQTAAFGSPVRPFSFFVQGVLALFMGQYPYLVHLIAVLTHAVVGCLLYVTVCRFTEKKHVALLASIIFVLNPLGMLATGWSAALMDRWYVLFGLAAFLCAEKYSRRESGSWLLPVWVFVWSLMAILSKETAMIMPGLLLLVLARDITLLKSKRFWLVAVAWALPIVLFLLYRLPSIIASFGAPAVSDYKASVTNIPAGLLVYSAYPFSFTLTEANNWVFLDSTQLMLAIAAHVLVVVFLWLKFGIKAPIIYGLMYFLFLAPVILIPIKGAHYMYGSSLVLSTALAAILCSRKGNYYVSRAFAVLGLAVLALHTLTLQNFVYNEGRCMSRVMISTEAMYIASGQPKAVDFQAEPGAANYVLYKINTGREQIGNAYPVKLSVSNWGDTPPAGALSLVMTPECLVYKK